MPTACVLYAGSEFAQSAGSVEQEFTRRGFSVHKQDLGYGAKISSVRKPAGGCDVSMWISHGGWDGPMIWDEGVGSQIDPTDTPQEWTRFRAFMGEFMKPRGMVIVHSCHSAGSNKYESTEGSWAERWVQQLSKDVNVYSTGVEGSTASAHYAWAVDFVRYAMDGGRYSRQAARAYAPGGVLQSPWRGWLRSGR